MEWVVHVTINYPEGEKIEYGWTAPTRRDVADMIEGYLKEDQPSSFVFVVTKQETKDH